MSEEKKQLFLAIMSLVAHLNDIGFSIGVRDVCPHFRTKDGLYLVLEEKPHLEKVDAFVVSLWGVLALGRMPQDHAVYMPNLIPGVDHENYIAHGRIKYFPILRDNLNRPCLPINLKDRDDMPVVPELSAEWKVLVEKHIAKQPQINRV